MITSNEWKIHKKLQDARDEQRRRRILLMMGRGNGKTRLLEEELEDMLTKSKTVIDYDLYSNAVSPWYKDSIDRFVDELIREHSRKYRESWKPILIDSGYSDWYRWHTYTNPYFTDMFKVEENE